MAEQSFQEKTEEPTERRLAKAREEGQVARSSDLSGSVLFLSGSLLLWIFGQQIAAALGDVTHLSAQWMLLDDLDLIGAVLRLRQLFEIVAVAIAPLLLGLAAIAAAVNFLQMGFLISFKSIAPRPERIDPIKNIKNIVSIRALVGFFKEVLKLLVVGVVAYVVLTSAWPTIFSLVGAEPIIVLLRIKELTFKLLLWIGGAYFCIGALDFVYERFRYRRQLRMTKQEVREEHKELEGDPEIKARIRQIQRQRARKRMLQDVPKADLVIKNPTERAVALKYDPATDIAPIVLAMGERLLALKIIEIAKKHNIPTVENKPLAKALLATAKVGHPIPVDLYMAVAEVLSEVYRRTGKRLH